MPRSTTHHRFPLSVAIVSGMLSLHSACGPAENDCKVLCDWWMGYCTAASHEGCMADCLESSVDDVDYALQQCPDFSASGCRGASCCLRFVYDDYYWEQNCS